MVGYVFSLFGFGELIIDVVFVGNGLIYENGMLFVEFECFLFKE